MKEDMQAILDLTDKIRSTLELLEDECVCLQVSQNPDLKKSLKFLLESTKCIAKDNKEIQDIIEWLPL